LIAQGFPEIIDVCVKESRRVNRSKPEGFLHSLAFEQSANQFVVMKLGRLNEPMKAQPSFSNSAGTPE
jgi:hypothetical protein